MPEYPKYRFVVYFLCSDGHYLKLFIFIRKACDRDLAEKYLSIFDIDVQDSMENKSTG